MFENQTTFVLGAGASCHYGYPTGETLVDEVMKMAAKIENYCDERIKISFLDRMVPSCVQERLGAKRDDQAVRDAWQQVSNDCRSLIERLQVVRPLVIDYFLGWNETLRSIGQLAIAAVILECEQKPQKSSGSQSRGEARNRDHWYRFIVHKLVSGCRESSDLLKNKVHFITFNYDTSLEYHLDRALGAIDLFTGDDVSHFFEDRILHVYGDVSGISDNRDEYNQLHNRLWIVGGREIRFSDYIPFAQFLDKCAVAARGIRTIDPHNKVIETALLSAKTRLTNSSVIYILGYGFDENNNDRIGLNGLLKSRDRAPKSIMFTNLGNLNTVNKRVGASLLGEHDAFLEKTVWGHPSEGDYLEKSVRNVYDALEMDFDAMEVRRLANSFSIRKKV